MTAHHKIYSHRAWTIAALALGILVFDASINTTRGACTNVLIGPLALPGCIRFGEPFSFSSEISGSPPYQIIWRRNGIVLTNATNACLYIESHVGATAGIYNLEVIGLCNTDHVEIDVPSPALVCCPESSTPAPPIYCPGSSLTVCSPSSPPVGVTNATYQWYKFVEYDPCQAGTALTNYTRLSMATNSCLYLTNLSSSDSGRYILARRLWTNGISYLDSDFGSLVTVTNPVPNIIQQPRSQTNVFGTSAAFSVLDESCTSTRYQWRHQVSRLPGETNSLLVIPTVQGSDVGSYSVVISNDSGSVTSAPAVLIVTSILPDAAFNAVVNGDVRTMAVQADGKVLLGGGFSTVSGQSRSRVARLNPDGTLDGGFNPGANSDVYSMALQADGKILLAGDFTILGGQARNRIARLNRDGTLDGAFNPGASATVSALAVQENGKILIGGAFTTVAVQSRNRIARLNTDGTLDGGFNPGAGDTVFALGVQADGKILLGGAFTTVSGQLKNRIARLNPEGNPDVAFNADANGAVYSIAVQADGRILLGGSFATISGQLRTNLARVLTDGGLDASFSPHASGSVRTLAVQSDGRILAGGSFTAVGGQARTRLVRLNQDGSLDAGFIAGAVGGVFATVYALASQTDGSILVGGNFTSLSGQMRTNLARLNSFPSAAQNLTYQSSTITWRRAGPAPEIWRAGFDYSTNGVDWLGLGAGTRIPGGWRLTDVSLPLAGTLRARGPVSGGSEGSSWFAESLLSLVPYPVILTGDDSFGIISNRFGFRVDAALGQAVVIEGSTNLSTWNPVATNLHGNSPFYFSETFSPTLPRRYYRARVLP